MKKRLRKTAEVRVNLPKIETAEVGAVDMVWVSADGRKMTPQQMDDRHILNCIRLLERRAGEAKFQLGSDKSVPEIAVPLFPIFTAMVKEMEKRMNGSETLTLQMIPAKPGRKFR